MHISFAGQYLAERYEPFIGSNNDDAVLARADEIASRFLHWHAQEDGKHRLTVPPAIYEAFRPLFGQKDLALPFDINHNDKEHRLAAFMGELAAAVKASAVLLAKREVAQGRIDDEMLESQMVATLQDIYPAALQQTRTMHETVAEAVQRAGSGKNGHALQ